MSRKDCTRDAACEVQGDQFCNDKQCPNFRDKMDRKGDKETARVCKHRNNCASVKTPRCDAMLCTDFERDKHVK